MTVAGHRTPSGRPTLTVALHRNDLLWNLSITGSDLVVARAYHQSATGHDARVADIHLRTGRESRLAEALISHYESIAASPSTRMLGSAANIKAIEGWPSLFKGNAVYDPTDGAEGWVKVLATGEGWTAETAWLETATHEARQCAYFRPAELAAQHAAPPEFFGGYGLRILPVAGVTAEQLLYEIQQLAMKHAPLTDKLGLFASLLVDQAFAALLEFRYVREAAKQNEAWRLPDRPYPWPDKLTQAIDEAGRFLTQDAALLARMRAEFRALGEKLVSRATVPFRDAHLKNRIISIIPEWRADGWEPFLRWLDRVTPEEMADWLRVHTTDIDFETAGCLVTQWDDPLHILTSPNLGIDTVRPATNGLPFLTRWGCAAPDPDGQRTLTATLLCRTFRELCRRAWYAKVMPATIRPRIRWASKSGNVQR